MARRGPTFVCQNCGAVTGRWQGKCESCGEWNTIVEESAAAEARIAGPGRPARKGRPFALEPLAGETHDAPRLPSGIAELDRVTGGGFVRGSVLLVGGDPGIGKSTLLIQAAAAIARAGHRAVYISGEEAVAQVRLRADRLRLGGAALGLAARTAGGGLREGATPSAWFLPERVPGAPGRALFAGIEGPRPRLVERQALGAPTARGTPRRAVVGGDQNRLAMVLAVLEAHCGVRLS